jgi:hypothetical protein
MEFNVQATSPVTHSRLEMAVGGRFSRNSRLNYVLRGLPALLYFLYLNMPILQFPITIIKI